MTEPSGEMDALKGVGQEELRFDAEGAFNVLQDAIRLRMSISTRHARLHSNGSDRPSGHRAKLQESLLGEQRRELKVMTSVFAQMVDKPEGLPEVIREEDTEAQARTRFWGEYIDAEARTRLLEQGVEPTDLPSMGAQE